MPHTPSAQSLVDLQKKEGRDLTTAEILGQSQDTGVPVAQAPVAKTPQQIELERRAQNAAGLPEAPPSTLPTQPTNTQTTTTPSTGAGFQFEESEEDRLLREALADQRAGFGDVANQVIDEDQIRADALANFQAEIDATNKVFADKIARAQVEGEGRLGSTGAIQARRGLLGSDFGGAQTDRVRDVNRQIEGTFENERDAIIASLRSKGRESGAAAIKEKREAKQAGLTSFIESLKGSAESVKTRSTELARQLLASGETIESLGEDELDDILSESGLSKRGFTSAYNDLVAANEAAQVEADAAARKLGFEEAKSQADIDKITADIAKGERDSTKPLKVGDFIYKFNGQEWINAGSAEAVAPTGPGSVDGVSPAAQTWVDLINEGRAKISDVPKNLKNEVSVGLSGTRQEDLPGATERFDQAETIIKTVDEAIALIGDKGIFDLGTANNPLSRSALAFIPGSEAKDFKSKLDTIQAVVGFDTLQKMRDASPTGGALGQVSEREITFLQSVQGSLAAAQSDEELTSVLNAVQDSFSLLRAVSKPGGLLVSPDGTQEVDINELNEQEIREAVSGGWK